MNAGYKQALAALASGSCFGVGLVISGMTQPQKVLDFLNPTGQWDASLLFVMVGAIGVHMFAYRWAKRHETPLFSAMFVLPKRSTVDGRLIVGATVFGMGWGLGGYCPGPAIVSAAAGGSVLVFLAALIAGMFLTAKLEVFFASRRQPFLISSEPTETS